MKHPDLSDLLWPVSGLGTALEYLAVEAKLLPKVTELPSPPELEADSPRELRSALVPWMDAVSLRLGVEVEAFHTSYSEVDSVLQQASPALLWVVHEGQVGCVALVKQHGQRGSVLGTDLRLHKIPMSMLADALRGPLESSVLPATENILARLNLSESQRRKTQKALMQERLGSNLLPGGWLLRLPPGAGFWKQLQEAHIPRYAGSLLGAHLLQYVCLLLAWWMIGQGALQGRINQGWLIAWLLLLISGVPLRLFVTWTQGKIAILTGAILKRRLLHGALRMDPEVIRRQGSGQLLSQVLESGAVESLSLTGGFLAVVSLFELVLAGSVLALGAGGMFHILLLLGWIVLSVLLVSRLFVRQRHWTHVRLDLTNELVERMVGHRTRLAQQPKEQWHDGEDQELQHYFETSSRMDRAAIVATTVLARGWLLVGLVGLLPAFVDGKASLGLIAVGLGGVLLAWEALGRFSQGLAQVASAFIAWEQVAPLFHAAAREESPGDPTFALAATAFPSQKADDSGNTEALAATETIDTQDTSNDEEQTRKPIVLQAHELSFRYRDKGPLVVNRCSLQIEQGDRLLLQGPSGGGKSTFASLLAGLRLPESGLLLLQGLDRHTLGEAGWRRYVVTAPQFHENHVLTNTFAFNLLMGREWPPSNEDMAEAYKICVALGLGPLLERMPGGLLQMVGENGWQLSHGEKSRLFIARALLQHSRLILLDESFAALDPENLSIALQCVLDRAPSLLVIAHP
ncbi:MAG: ABC transporter ATP-binding protein [Deltaproteobacteria bacterium]|nr:MAG: ABC transporter ATP-binding protein [Deltaproteobacteria bacterium]